jgi:hypothetical protein
MVLELSYRCRAGRLFQISQVLGIEWCDSRPAAKQAFQYRLAGFRFEAANAASQ